MATFVSPQFVERVEASIAANENKGPWAQFKPTAEMVESEIQAHFIKLRRAMRAGDPKAVTEYATDVAALCMKADELYGQKLNE